MHLRTQEEKSLSWLFSYLLIFIFSLNITERIAKGLNIKKVMEAVGTEDAEGIDDLWKVSCLQTQALSTFCY